MATFPPEVRREIEGGFDAAWDKAHKNGLKQIPSNNPYAKEERALFVRILEGFADAVPEFSELESRKQQDRRRALNKVATALGKLADGYNELDPDARAFLAYMVEQQAEGAETAKQTSPLEYFIEAETTKDAVVSFLSAAHLGALKAAKELPVLHTSAARSIALGIERQFWQLGFEFAASSSSFAAKCIDAVLTASGIEATSLQYLIQETKDSPESMSALMRKGEGTAH